MNSTGLKFVATAVRTLTMDAIQKANSGHPGLPMGCAELGALLFGEILKHFPGDPEWINRDRFVLSAGHGSMLLYSLLHLSGYDLSLEDIKNFRQLGSKTPGHPEYGVTPGVETTTGPLGQGLANAVGMAIAERMLAARFNTDSRRVIDHYTYVLAGDGDLMEGVSSEACSLAGHLGLGKLIVFYDSNHITIEGSTDLAFTEDVLKRFEAYNWQAFSADAYDLEGIVKVVEEAKKDTNKPALIKINSIIAKGAPNLAGSHKTHGAPLGDEEVREAKRAIGVPDPEGSLFYIPAEAKAYFTGRKEVWDEEYKNWKVSFSAWSEENPELFKQWKQFFNDQRPKPVQGLPQYKEGDKLATRKAGGQALNVLAENIPNLIGGSADLAPSNSTYLKGMGSFQKDNHLGRNLHFGVREHAMGAIVNGITLHGGLRAFCATFLVFSDYMRPAIRMAALMSLPVIYVFTHDSVFVGEDGPTHEPVEQLAALRTIPGLLVLRPSDAEETNAAWIQAINHIDGPSALILTRQSLTVFAKEDSNWRENMPRGAYIVKDSKGRPEIVIVATGSEVNLALEIQQQLGSDKVRVISMVSRSLFLKEKEAYGKELIPDGSHRVVLEAGVAQGWGEIAGSGGMIRSIERFGESGPGKKVYEYLGFNAGEIAALIRRVFASS